MLTEHAEIGMRQCPYMKQYPITAMLHGCYMMLQFSREHKSLYRGNSYVITPATLARRRANSRKGAQQQHINRIIGD